MDFVRPVESVIPGVQGRVLAVLARVETELTMRTVAQLAGVSTNRAVAVLNQLIHLGLVERREAGSAALVRLDRDNEASQAVLNLSTLTDRVLERLEEAAADMKPAPVSIVLFGSLARGEADEDSDIDVLVVRDPEIPDDDGAWLDAVGRWTSFARRVTGNPVNVVEKSADEVPNLTRRKGSVWQDIASEGRTLIGPDLGRLARPGGKR